MPTPARQAKKKKPGTRRVTRTQPAPRAAVARRKKPAPVPAFAPAATAAPAPPKVRVRMFRQGLGDCFLLTFNPGGDERHILIDCGTLGAKATPVRLHDVIAEIDKTTNGHLHLVVATHQHQDHLSGFAKLADQFSPAKGKLVDNVWLAWTEDPKNPEAQKLANVRDSMAIAVKSAAQALQAVNQTSEPAMALQSLLGFFGDNSVTSAAGTAEGAVFAAAARNSMDVARNLAKQAEYRTPGEPVLEPAWMPGFRIYVLGPPHDLEKLHDTGEHGSSELYALASFTTAALQAAAQAGKKDGQPNATMDPPFDARFQLKRSDPRIVAALQDTYLTPAQAWRSVDTDWLNAASGLAIQLDKFTNNTSLVLAIERIADGRVLLFPGDAQEGNWLSWHDPSNQWQVQRADGTTSTVGAKDLLARTVFYKVGHHSSHNATAKDRGLEMMTTQTELTAFIPVDRQVALGRSPTGSWKMPARQLYRALLDKCQGRVVRSDIGWAANVKVGARGTESEFAGLGTDAEWAAWSKSQLSDARVQVADTHIDFVLD
jgi:beta-lactamase superfamily II metal-dependent hydrolase